MALSQNKAITTTLILAAVALVTAMGVIIIRQPISDGGSVEKLTVSPGQDSEIDSGAVTAVRDYDISDSDNDRTVNRPAPLSFDSADAPDQSRPENAKGYDRLSPEVLAIIEEVQERLLQDQTEAALNELNALYERFDELNSFEQQTVLNFYSNTLLSLEMYEETITAFSLLLTIPELNTTTYNQTLRSLGQLHGAVGNSEAAVYYLNQWLEAVGDEPGNERRVELTHRQIAAFSRGVKLAEQ